MKYIIIDDEPLARKGIRILADQVSDLVYVAEFSNPLQVENSWASIGAIDLMFLDIEMPGVNGLQYLKELRPDVHVILTTAYDQYAIEAFELDVADYLLKPVKLSRFLNAVKRVREYKSLTNTEPSFNEDAIYLKADRKFVRLHLADILYIKGLKDYVIVHTTDGRKHMTALNMSTIYNQLPDKIFARVSKSYIVNTHYIESVDIDTLIVHDQEIPLGNSYKDGFIDKYIKGTLLKR